jgi:hypothetical protein
MSALMSKIKISMKFNIIKYNIMKRVMVLSALGLLLVSFVIVSSPINLRSKKTTGSVYGSIIDRNNKKALEYASVVIYNRKDSSPIAATLTDNKGNFRFDKLPAGRYYVIAWSFGYNKQFVSDIALTNHKKDITLNNIPLEHASPDFGIFEVKATRI